MAQVVVNNALQEWNDEIKKAYAALTPDDGGACYIMSVTRRKQGIIGGTISKVTPETAALHIAGETHREATEEEVVAWHADQIRRRNAILGESAKRETKFALDLGPLAEALVKLGAAGGLQSPSVVSTNNADAPPVNTPSAAAAVESAIPKPSGGKKVVPAIPVPPPVATPANNERF